MALAIYRDGVDIMAGAQIGQFVGSISIQHVNDQSGSVEFPELAFGSPITPILFGNDGKREPIVTISGTTVSWSPRPNVGGAWFGTIWLVSIGTEAGPMWFSGSNGVVQIGSVKPPLRMTGKGTVYTRAKVDGDGLQFATSVADVPTGLVALRPYGPMALMRNGFMAGTAPIGTAIDWWSFSQTGGQTFGPAFVSTYGPSGELIFSDNMNPARYAGQSAGSLAGSGTIAAIQARLGYSFEWVQGGGPPNQPNSEEYFQMAGFAIAWQANGGTVEFKHSQSTDAGTQNPDYSQEYSQPPVLVLIDVTGY